MQYELISDQGSHFRKKVGSPT